MAVLCQLARRPGVLVSSDDLLETVWRDTHVTAGVLARAIHLIRRALGDNARRPRFIETVPRRGFRLIAAAEAAAEDSPLLRPREGRAHPYATPLVGREQERAELEGLLRQAEAGQAALALLSGEPGVGKTRLVQEICTDARSRGFIVLQGHCYESEGAPPYGPWIEILAATARITDPDALRDLLADGAPEVAKLLPELRRILPDLPAPLELPPAEGRRYLFRCLQGLLERSSRSRPQLLVLEDLHWADEASLLLLDHLALALPDAPVLLLGTFRDVGSRQTERSQACWSISSASVCCTGSR